MLLRKLGICLAAAAFCSPLQAAERTTDKASAKSLAFSDFPAPSDKEAKARVGKHFYDDAGHISSIKDGGEGSGTATVTVSETTDTAGVAKYVQGPTKRSPGRWVTVNSPVVVSQREASRYREGQRVKLAGDVEKIEAVVVKDLVGFGRGNDQIIRIHLSNAKLSPARGEDVAPGSVSIPPAVR